MLFVRFTPAKVPDEWRASEQELEGFRAQMVRRLPVVEDGAYGNAREKMSELYGNATEELSAVYEAVLERGSDSW